MDAKTAMIEKQAAERDAKAKAASAASSGSVDPANQL